MLQTYLRGQYPKGKVRTALKNHRCNGSLDGKDPGCGGRIDEYESYFDTMERNEFYQAGRFCRKCSMLVSAGLDLFDMVDNRQVVN